MRKLLLILCVFVATAAMTAFLGRDRWPGAHPHALSTYRQRWEARQSEWSGTPLPADTPAAATFSNVVKPLVTRHGFNLVHFDHAVANVAATYPSGAPFDPPIQMAGRTG